MTVSLTIDDRRVSVPEGTLIIEAARQLGIDIPVFCYHPRMESVGMCRMCLVTVGTPAIDRTTGQPQRDENGQPVIRWFPHPQTSCTMPVSEGMVVITDSAQVAAERKAILEFLLTSHPLDCPVCDKGGECPLQDLTFRYGPGVSRFDYDSKHHGAKHYALGDLIVLDQERCVLCARCTRFQAEIAGDPVLAIENRGRDAMIVSYSDPPFDSHYSGNTTDICPVGALTTRDFRFLARPWELTHSPGICNLCGVGCNLVHDTRNGTIKRIMPRRNDAVNEIWLCDKGRFVHHYYASPDRLTKPLVRREGELIEASWQEALQYAADRLADIKEQHGPDAIGGIAGAFLSNEDLYLFQKLFRQVIGTHNVDYRVGLDAALQDETAFRVGVGVGTDLSLVGQDTAILVVGSDLDQEAPVLYLQAAGAARRGARLINAGGRTTKLDGKAHHVLRYRYGTAVHVLLGMLNVVLNEKSEQGKGLTGNEIVPSRVLGLENLKARVADWPLERVAETTGVPIDTLRAATFAFAEARNGMIVFGAEAGNHPALGQAVSNLAIVTGFVGRPNNGVLPVLPQANSRGAMDLGVVPFALPGYEPVSEPGQSAREMKQGQVRGLWVAAADPLSQVSRPPEMEFLMVQDLFLTDTALQADVVLPATAAGERDGTFTNLQRRLQHFEPAVSSPGSARPDWIIISHLANLLGADWTYATVEAVLTEMAESVPLYAGMQSGKLVQKNSVSRHMSDYIIAGMSYRSRTHEEFQWPSQSEDDSATLSLDWIDPPVQPDDTPGFTLVAPRVLYDAGRLLSLCSLLETHLVQPHVAVSDSDTSTLGVSKGDLITISGNGQEVTLPCRLDGTLPPGIVTIPRNLSGRPAESLIGYGQVFGPVRLSRPDAGSVE